MLVLNKMIFVALLAAPPLFAQDNNAANGNSNSNGNGNASGNGNGNTITININVGDICFFCSGGGGSGGGVASVDQAKKWHPPMVQKSGMASSN